VTGGESGWIGLKEKTRRPFSELGSKVFLFGNGEDDDEYVESAGLELAEVNAHNLFRPPFSGERTRSWQLDSEKADTETACVSCRKTDVPDDVKLATGFGSYLDIESLVTSLSHSSSLFSSFPNRPRLRHSTTLNPLHPRLADPKRRLYSSQRNVHDAGQRRRDEENWGG